MLFHKKYKMLYLWLPNALLSMALVLSIPLFAVASSQKTFRGEIAVEHSYESNPDRVASDAESEHESRVAPRMTYTRDTRLSSFSLLYAPSLVHSRRTEEDRVDHLASAAYNIQARKRLEFDFSNTYRLAYTSYTYTEEEIAEEEIVLSDRRGRRRYWTNSASASMNYEYGPQSFFNTGYNNRILRNKDAAYTDYVRHSPFVSVSHRISHQWRIMTGYTFTRGNFDGADDITTHSGNVSVHYSLSPHTSIFSRLGYIHNEYEQSQRDYEVYTAAVGVNRQMSPLRSIDIETGASLVKRDLVSDTRALFLRASLDSQIKRGSWRVYGESGIDQRYYAGIDEEGLSRYWLAGVRINRTLTENVSASTGVYRRDDEYLERSDMEKEKRIRADARITYSFARWHRLTAGYSYTDLDADRKPDSYENHRVFIRLTAGRDLLKW